MKNIVFSVLAALLFTSCEKTIDLDYENNQSKIVIEGNITNENGPYFVKISKSISLTNTENYPTIDNAVVTISDNAGNSEILTPQGNGLYRTNSIIGTQGRTYTLTVNTENQIYTAKSTMPQKVDFDSIKIDEMMILGEKRYNIIPIFTDPIAKGNNYRFVLSINNQLINKHFIQNDEVINGIVNILRLELSDDDFELKQGDLIDIKMNCVDPNVRRYYTTLALIFNNGPAAGTTPANPPNNISNGALGLFSAHTVETKTVSIP